MSESRVKAIIAAIGIFGAGALAYAAYSMPGYFGSQINLAGLLLLEVMLAAIWFYRQTFLPVVLVSFLLAGVDLSIGSWNVARWVVLGVGALVGCALMLKERGHRFGMFHILAAFAILSAVVSAAVSRYTLVSTLKVCSLLLLFIYASTGARLSVAGRENRFFPGLLIGCEIFVSLIALSYLLGYKLMGNPNSLGAVMGVAAAPLLFWGMLLNQDPFASKRRLLFFGIAMYLTFASHARASMLAAVISCGLLCFVLRRYVMLAQGMAIIAILTATLAIVQPHEFSEMVSSLTANVLLKADHPEQGLLSSRTSPWQDSVDSIREHFWFGSGFGTSDKGEQASEGIGKFSTSRSITTEHGSSYLAITSWVGVVGVIPFLLLIGALLLKIARTVFWIRRSGNFLHGAVPLAMVVLAGLVHAFFEDWLFAPGYYLCIFFWSMAFIFMDQAMLLTVPNVSSHFLWNRMEMRQDLRAAIPGR